MGWVLDLDGVMWLADQPIERSAEAVALLDAAGEQVLFVTNNSSAPVGEVEAKLERHGVDAAGRVLTSALAAAQLVSEGERVYVLGGAGLCEAVEARGAEVVGGGRIDAVLVGFDRGFTWDRLREAATAIRAGARFVASNDDATYPTPEGPVPGGGAIVAAVATAAGVAPRVAGKPHDVAVAMVRDRMGYEGIGVGDRPSTDGAFARALGYRFGLVMSGVTTDADLPVSPEPDVMAANLFDLVALELSRR